MSCVFTILILLQFYLGVSLVVHENRPSRGTYFSWSAICSFFLSVRRRPIGPKYLPQLFVETQIHTNVPVFKHLLKWSQIALHFYTIYIMCKMILDFLYEIKYFLHVVGSQSKMGGEIKVWMRDSRGILSIYVAWGWGVVEILFTVNILKYFRM